MTARRTVQVLAILDREHPYKFSRRAAKRCTLRVCEVLPWTPKVSRDQQIRFIAAVVALPYRLGE